MVFYDITPFKTFIFKSVFHLILCSTEERKVWNDSWVKNLWILWIHLFFQAPFLIQIMFYILYQLSWNAIHTSSAVFYSKLPTVDSLYMNYVQWSQKEGKGACVGSNILDPCSQIFSSILIWFSWTCSVTQTLQCNLIQLSEASSD